MVQENLKLFFRILKVLYLKDIKYLVFSSFVKHLNLYAEELRKKRIRFSMLTGASINREKIVNSFQDDPGE